jgi:hypothetical protein
MDGQATTAKAIRCYQCSAALSGAEATLTRINVSKEDKALIAKLVFAGTPGQQVGDMAQYLGSGPISIPVQQPLDIVEMDASVSGIVTPIMVSQYVFKTVCPSASTIG